MELSKTKPNDNPTDVAEENEMAVRIGSRYRKMLDDGRSEINKDTTFKKRIGYARYVEKLIEDHWQDPIEDLKKEREGSEDWLKILHKREAPDMSFFDWLRSRVDTEHKKSAKRKTGSEK